MCSFRSMTHSSLISPSISELKCKRVIYNKKKYINLSIMLCLYWCVCFYHTHTHTHTHHAYRKQPLMESYGKERFMIYDLFSLELSSPLFCLRMGAWDRKRSRRRCCLDHPLLEAKKHEQEGRKAMSRLDFSFPWEASPQERRACW